MTATNIEAIRHAVAVLQLEQGFLLFPEEQRPKLLAHLRETVVEPLTKAAASKFTQSPSVPWPGAGQLGYWRREGRPLQDLYESPAIEFGRTIWRKFDPEKTGARSKSATAYRMLLLMAAGTSRLDVVRFVANHQSS